MVFLVYTQVENHILNPVIMSRTVRINPLLVLMAVLVGAALGNLVGGLFGGFVAALLAIPVGRGPAGAGPRGVAGHRPEDPEDSEDPPEGEIVAEAGG